MSQYSSIPIEIRPYQPEDRGQIGHPRHQHRGRRLNQAAGFQLGYTMPRYYDDDMDGVTYQQFFDGEPDDAPQQL